MLLLLRRDIAQEMGLYSDRAGHLQIGSEIEDVFRLRVAELTDRVVWQGMVVSGSEAAGNCLQHITHC